MSADKPLPATPKKLQDARKRGEVPRSAQVDATGAFIGALAVLWIGHDTLFERFARFFDAALQAAGPHAGTPLGERLLELAIPFFLVTVLPFLGVVVAMVLLTGFLQTKGNISFEPLSLKPEKLDPVSNVQRLVSMQQMLDLAKKLLEAVVLAALAAALVWHGLPALLSAALGSALDSLRIGLGLGLQLCGLFALAWIAVSALDYAIQRFGFMRRQRMGYDEVQREHKDTQGDPHVRGRRRQMHREASASPPGGSLRDAKALIANPTHVAVALAFEAGRYDVPTVVAKAQDLQALALRAEAEALGIPVFEDVPLARGLFAATAVGEPVAARFYEPVAQVFVWLERLSDGAEPADG